MSLLKKLGKATGLLVEVEDGSNGALPELSPEEQAAAMARLEAELAPRAASKMPPVRRPQARAAGPSVSALAPEEIRTMVDEEISAAAKPAYDLYLTLDNQLATSIPNATARATAVVGVMQATHGFTPSNVLFDLIEALQACEAVKAEVEGGRDAEIAEQVTELESDADAKIARAAELRAEADRLDAEATAQKADASNRRTTITQAVEAALAYISVRITTLTRVRTDIENTNPGITPQEPPGNVRPQ